MCISGNSLTVADFPEAAFPMKQNACFIILDDSGLQRPYSMDFRLLNNAVDKLGPDSVSANGLVNIDTELSDTFIYTAA